MYHQDKGAETWCMDGMPKSMQTRYRDDK